MTSTLPKVFTNLIMGIKLTSLLKLVIRNGISLKPVYLMRFIALLPNAVISQILIIAERLKYSKKYSKTEIIKPPVFIIGHWRSGTTFLHQLFALDDQLTVPTMVQTIIPEHFIFGTKYYTPVLNRLMPPKRPMDEVEMKPHSPMEDEFALLRMGSPSPLEKIFFPSGRKKFLSDMNEFIPQGKDLVQWKRNLKLFLKKITWLTEKQIVLKNPFHTPRVELLAKMFPGAKFVHIVRHPYKIIPSSINMWDIISNENSFKEGWEKPQIEDLIKIIGEFNKITEASRAKLKENEFAEIRFEDLESNPIKSVSEIYKRLDLKFTNRLESAISRFLEEKKGFKKNVFNLSDDEKLRISRELSDYFIKYNYSP